MLVLQGGFYERKLRLYLLSKEETAIAAYTLLIPWAEDATTAALETNDATEAGYAGPSGPHQITAEAAANADNTGDVTIATPRQKLQLLPPRPFIPYSAVVKEVEGFLPFWRVRGWKLNPFISCIYTARVLLPAALRQKLLAEEKREKIHRQSYLWNGDSQRSSRRSTVAKRSIDTEIRAFVRRLISYGPHGVSSTWCCSLLSNDFPSMWQAAPFHV